MNTRREFVQGLAATAGVPLLGAGAAAAPAPPAGPDVGSLFPFIRAQAVKKDFPLSFLDKSFTDRAAWKRQARGKLLELLHYAPEKCDPRPEVVERIDRGDHMCERVFFNTTPDVRVPAYVLVPKKADRPLPGIVALHDHGGFYLWGKEKLVETDDEHPVLTAFKKRYYAGTSIATALVKQGYVGAVIDMFYWGERRMILDADADDWRKRPKDITAERIAAFNRRSSESEQLVGRTIYSAGFTWPGVMFWDDIRTVDYLLSRRVTSKKARMWNDVYLGEVNFWRCFLSDRSPNIVLNFGDQSAVIGAELLEFTVDWPGIPGDSKPFANTTYDQDLFSSTEFDDAVAGDDPEWEDDDES